MLLTQKYRDLEFIFNQNNKEQAIKIDKLITENNNLKLYINKSDKIMLTINFFIKKI